MYQQITPETLDRATVMNESGIGIPPHYNIFYYYSVFYSAECANRAFGFYEHLLQYEDVDPLQLVGAVQEAISHAGALSFYFWNMGGTKTPKEIKEYIKNRSEILKKEFNLNDDSPLKDRSLRNMFEHFDEKSDIFLINNIAGTFYPMPVLGKHTDIEDEQISKYFKLLDIENKCLVLLNKKFFFEDIRKEVSQIYEIAKEKIRTEG